MTAANTGNWKVLTGTAASPQVLTEIEEVLDLSEFGDAVELIDVTNFDTDAGQKEFIGGLAEGDEFTVECNYLTGAATHQAFLRDDKSNTRLFRIASDETSPETRFAGSCVNMGWKLTPSLTDQNKITFTFKITGSITETP